MALIWLLGTSLWAATLADVERLLAARQYRQALEALDRITPQDARWQITASKAWDGLDDPAMAVAHAEKAIELEPANAGHHVHLGQIFLARNTPKAALEIFEEADSLFPETFVIRLGRALAAKELQLYEEAERDLRWCLEKQPGSALAFDALATIYIHQSRYADAGRLAREFVARNATDYRGPYFEAAARDGQLLPEGETLGLLEESLRRNPRFAAAHALKGKILLKQEKLEEAKKSLQQAIGHRPDLVQAHLNLARTLRALGEESAAAVEFETVRLLKAKEQAPVPTLLYHRGKRPQN